MKVTVSQLSSALLLALNSQMENGPSTREHGKALKAIMHLFDLLGECRLEIDVPEKEIPFFKVFLPDEVKEVIGEQKTPAGS